MINEAIQKSGGFSVDISSNVQNNFASNIGKGPSVSTGSSSSSFSSSSGGPKIGGGGLAGGKRRRLKEFNKDHRNDT